MMLHRKVMQGVATLSVTVGLLLSALLTSPARGQCDWILQHALPESNTFFTIRDIAMWDDLRGVAVGQQGNMYRTTDGGATWSVTMIPFAGFNAVTTLPPNFAVAVGINGMVHLSHDAGATWVETPARPANGFFDMYSVDFISETEGWVVPEPLSSVLFHTTDAGATWEPQVPPGNFILCDVDFLDASTGFLIGPRDLMWTTTDGGSTWIRQYLPPHINPISSGTPSVIKMVNANVGWITAPRGYIVYTADGGVTWQRQDAGIADTQNVEPFISPLSETEAWLIDHTGTVRHTVDGGDTWQVVPTGQENSVVTGFRGIVALPSGNIWAAGGDGHIIHRNPISPPLVGDLNEDCLLTLDDLCFWNHHQSDVNGDGAVNMSDAQWLGSIIGLPFGDCNNNAIPDSCETARWHGEFGQQVSSIQFPDPPHPYGGDQIMLNRYVVSPGIGPDGETITAVEYAWGWQMTGKPITVAIWSDPDGDGDPTDAILLSSKVFTGPVDSWNTVELLTVQPTFVGHANDSFFVGVLKPYDAATPSIVHFGSNYALNSGWTAVGNDLQNLNANFDLRIMSGGITGGWALRVLSTGLFDANGDGTFDNCNTVVIAGDLNADGIVDLNDRDVLIAQFGLTVNDALFNPAADLNGDGIVNEADVAIFNQILPPCPADCTPVGGNGLVNIDDLVSLLNEFGPSVSGCDNTPANANGSFGNGVINIDDLVNTLNAFGVCP